MSKLNITMKQKKKKTTNKLNNRLKWLMSSTKNVLFKRTEFNLKVKQFLVRLYLPHDRISNYQAIFPKEPRVNKKKTLLVHGIFYI